MDGRMKPSNGLTPGLFCWLSSRQPLSLDELWRQLGYGHGESKQVDQLMNLAHSMTMTFVASGGIVSPGMLSWANTQDQKGLVRLTCRFLSTSDAGTLFWPDDHKHANYGLLQYSTDKGVIEKLMIQVFFNLVLEQHNPVQKPLPSPDMRLQLPSTKSRNRASKKQIKMAPYPANAQAEISTHDDGQKIPASPRADIPPVAQNALEVVKGNAWELSGPGTLTAGLQPMHRTSSSLLCRGTIDLARNHDCANGSTTGVSATSDVAPAGSRNMPFRQILPAHPPTPPPDGPAGHSADINPLSQSQPQLARRAITSHPDCRLAANDTPYSLDTSVSPANAGAHMVQQPFANSATIGTNAVVPEGQTHLGGQSNVEQQPHTPTDGHVENSAHSMDMTNGTVLYGSSPSAPLVNLNHEFPQVKAAKGRNRKPLPSGRPSQTSGDSDSVTAAAAGRRGSLRKRKSSVRTTPVQTPKRRTSHQRKCRETKVQVIRPKPRLMERPSDDGSLTEDDHGIYTFASSPSRTSTITEPPENPPSLVNSSVNTPDSREEPVEYVKQSPDKRKFITYMQDVFDAPRTKSRKNLSAPKKRYIPKKRKTKEDPPQIKKEPLVTPTSPSATLCITSSAPVPIQSACTPCLDTPMVDCAPTPVTPVPTDFNTQIRWGASSTRNTAMDMPLFLPTAMNNMSVAPASPFVPNAFVHGSVQPPTLLSYAWDAQNSLNTNNYFGVDSNTVYNASCMSNLNNLMYNNAALPWNNFMPFPGTVPSSYGQPLSGQIENMALMSVGGFNTDSTTEIWETLAKSPEMKALTLLTEPRGLLKESGDDNL